MVAFWIKIWYIYAEMKESYKMLLIDCDGTCYPWDKEFNGSFKPALKQTAVQVGISSQVYEQKSLEVRGKHVGMMNFILALGNGDLSRYHQFVQLWCQKLEYQRIQPNPRLGDLLQKNKDSVCIVTNNCRAHVDLVWKRLFPERQPDVRVMAIEDTYDGQWFHSKQDTDGFCRVCRQLNLSPEAGILLDDSPIVLGIAKQAGLQTRRVTAQKNLMMHLNELVRE